MFCAKPLGVSMMSQPPEATIFAAAATNASGEGTCSITSIAVTSGNCFASGEAAYCSTVPVKMSRLNFS
jgi:hypothetical protein